MIINSSQCILIALYKERRKEREKGKKKEKNYLAIMSLE